jgi:hypothetical protein
MCAFNIDEIDSGFRNFILRTQILEIRDTKLFHNLSELCKKSCSIQSIEKTF